MTYQCAVLPLWNARNGKCHSGWGWPHAVMMIAEVSDRQSHLFTLLWMELVQGWICLHSFQINRNSIARNAFSYPCFFFIAMTIRYMKTICSILTFQAKASGCSSHQVSIFANQTEPHSPALMAWKECKVPICV